MWLSKTPPTHPGGTISHQNQRAEGCSDPTLMPTGSDTPQHSQMHLTQPPVKGPCPKNKRIGLCRQAMLGLGVLWRTAWDVSLSYHLLTALVSAVLSC